MNSFGLSEIYRTKNRRFFAFLWSFLTNFGRSHKFFAKTHEVGAHTVSGIYVAFGVPADASTVVSVPTVAVILAAMFYCSCLFLLLLLDYRTFIANLFILFYYYRMKNSIYRIIRLKNYRLPNSVIKSLYILSLLL